MENIMAIIIGPLGVAVGALIQYKINEKNNYYGYITGERQEWRNKIRELTEKLYSGEDVDYNLLKVQYQIRLNPGDSEDKKSCLFKLLLNFALKKVRTRRKKFCILFWTFPIGKKLK